MQKQLPSHQQGCREREPVVATEVAAGKAVKQVAGATLPHGKVPERTPRVAWIRTERFEYRTERGLVGSYSGMKGGGWAAGRSACTRRSRCLTRSISRGGGLERSAR